MGCNIIVPVNFGGENMSLGANIRRLRKDHGWSQEQLGIACKIKTAHISRLENDSADPKLSTIYKLISALGCSPDALLMDKEKVGINTNLKATIERLSTLKDEEKEHIIAVVDGYMIACGLRESLSEEKTNWVKRLAHSGGYETPLPDKEKKSA